ncbi:DUF11 domain-containing protein [Kribbella capetownensis]|uniref:DUF11 domain-containing protein n=1 Tax=Kribbella capetownensis TaxID=1572659 RepID=UPI00192DF4DE|nr:DUF11 domain-containing protein [Kribbella capetownensis]
MRTIRAALVTALVGAGLVTGAQVAAAAPPSSEISVGTTSVAPGQTFTITQTLNNDRDFDIIGAKAGLYAKEPASLPSLIDIVACPEAYACDTLGSSVRGGFHEVKAGESVTLHWTFRVKDDAPAGTIQLQHQFIGENYAFEILDGPSLTIEPAATNADIAVSMTASVRTLLISRITYTVTIKNNGPSAATDVRVVGTYPNRLLYAGGSCTRVGTTRTVNCDVGSLASGASVTRTFAADAGLLTIGKLVATAERTASSPDDPAAGNDEASRTCTALTSLMVRC